MAHDEFPPLTRSGIEVLQRANTANYENHVGPGGIRPFAAAVIREAVKQAVPFHSSTLQVVTVADLLRIADNLHSPPPPPPTREQMEIALADLLKRTDDPAGCHEDSPIAEFANILRRGIAHYCTLQP